MSRLSRTVLLLVAGSVGILVVDASAQPTAPGMGFGLSLGTGSAAPGSDFDKLGVAFGLRMGVNGRGMSIGAGFDAVAWQLDGKDWDLGVAGPYLAWWPGEKPFFVRGVIGFGDRTRTVVGSSIDHDPGLGAIDGPAEVHNTLAVDSNEFALATVFTTPRFTQHLPLRDGPHVEPRTTQCPFSLPRIETRPLDLAQVRLFPDRQAVPRSRLKKVVASLPT